jgi:hypothetical protein
MQGPHGTISNAIKEIGRIIEAPHSTISDNRIPASTMIQHSNFLLGGKIYGHLLPKVFNVFFLHIMIFTFYHTDILYNCSQKSTIVYMLGSILVS